MGGTQEGYRKRRLAMIRKAGGLKAYLAQQRVWGAIGGKISGPNSPNNFKNNRALASRAGKTKRTHIDQPDAINRQQYKNEREIAYNDRSFKMGREIANTIEEDQTSRA